jgi:hypothetical protein
LVTGIIWIKPEGNMGNRALQYLAAAGIAMHAPDVKIQNILLPEWGMSAPHPDYLVLPPRYYKSLQERSGLELIFYGQIGNDAYSASLRAAFPAARFIPGVNRGHDFEVLRRSVNIAPGISTFAWLAAWLSEAAQIYLPVGGIFNPAQFHRRMFLPLDDPAYRYTLLPFGKATDLKKQPAQFALLQETLGQLARPVHVPELQQICQRAAALQPPQALLGGFDPDFYALKYPDVAGQLPDRQPSALHHYLHTGFREGRQPFAFDQAFYTGMYPEAAMAVAAGYYRDPLHHYQTTGRTKGYRPTP